MKRSTSNNNNRNKKKKEGLRNRKFHEQLEIEQSNEREEFFVSESDARQWIDVTESQAWMQQLIDFYEAMLKPSTKLMVRRQLYEDTHSQLMLNTRVSKLRTVTMKQQTRVAEGHYKAMQQELAHLRSQVRDLSADVDRHLDAVREGVHRTLTGFVSAVEASIIGERQNCEESGRLLNEALEKSRTVHCALVRKIDAKAEAISQVLQEHSSMHTCIPPRIRSRMVDSEKTDLMLMFDTLSFEDVVMKYLRYRYCPGPDTPDLGGGPDDLGDDDEKMRVVHSSRTRSGNNSDDTVLQNS